MMVNNVRNKLLIPGLICASLFLSGCGLLYRVEVQQGNVITREMLSQLRAGMSKEKIRFIMGSPMLEDPFHKNRWDYYYSLHQDNERQERRHVTLYFEQDRLVRLEGDTDMPLRGPGEESPGGELPLL